MHSTLSKYLFLGLIVLCARAQAFFPYALHVVWDPTPSSESAQATLEQLVDQNQKAWSREMGFEALILDTDVPSHHYASPIGILSRGFVGGIFMRDPFSLRSRVRTLERLLERHPVTSLELFCDEGGFIRLEQAVAKIPQLEKIRSLHFVMNATSEVIATECVRAMHTVLSSPLLTNLRSFRISPFGAGYPQFQDWRPIFELPVMRKLTGFYFTARRENWTPHFFEHFLRSDWSNLDTLALDGMDLENGDLEQLVDLPGLAPKFLSLRRSRFNLDAIGHFARHPAFIANLEDLDLTSSDLRRGRTRNSDAWAPLAQIRRLHTLRLGNTNVYRSIRELVDTPLPNLRRLDVTQGDDPNATDYQLQRRDRSLTRWIRVVDALSKASGLKHLLSLRVGNEITGGESASPYREGIERLANGTSLRQLRHLEAPLYGYLPKSGSKSQYQMAFPTTRSGLPLLNSVRVGATLVANAASWRLEPTPVFFLEETRPDDACFVNATP